MTHEELARALIQVVQALEFDQTPDRMQRGGAVADFPSLDLAVVGFPARGAPVWANVLFSREMPGGWVGDIGKRGELPANVRYVADITDSHTVSTAWQPGADWGQLNFPWLAGELGVRFVAPYPASLLKVMVALGVGLALDAGRCTQQEVQGPGRAMMVDSDNDATTHLVKRLHDWGLIRRGADGHETHNALHTLFAQRGLGSLRLSRTAPDGGWGNAAGSGVGHIQMTGWDTVRLLWLLDPQAPPAPWAGAAPLVSAASRDLILRWMGEHSPNRILFRDEVASGLHFTHKTGTTANYGSDAGIVHARPPGRRHYLVALLSNLGSRYGPPDAEFDVSPKLSRLGLAVDAIMRRFLERDRVMP